LEPVTPAGVDPRKDALSEVHNRLGDAIAFVHAARNCLDESSDWDVLVVVDEALQRLEAINHDFDIALIRR
jgi:hypothetical protein